MIHDEYLVDDTHWVSWEFFFQKKNTWIFMPCKKSPWGWAFYPPLSFNTRQSQGREKLLTNIYIFKKKGNWSLKKLEHMGLSSSIYMMYLQNWTTGNSPTIACAWSNKANIPCVNSDLSLFPWEKKKRTVSLEESAPPKHTLTHIII